MIRKSNGFLRQISWPMVFLQVLAVLGLIFLIEHAFGPIKSEKAISYGVIAYFIYSIVSRQVLAWSYQKGLRLFKKRRFKDAISAFERSYSFFQRHPWIDRLRCLTMMSPSLASYREMALVNIALCYGQMGEVEESKSYFQRALDEFPGSMLAKVGLNTIRVYEQSCKGGKGD